MNLSRRVVLGRTGAVLSVGFTRVRGAEADFARIEIWLDPEIPARSHGRLIDSKDGERWRFPVGLGKQGVRSEGQSFKGGFSLLGEFRINAILSAKRFEMDPRLIEQSAKSAEWLREHLFRNMSSIDFDGDGKGGEYGAGFLGLDPVENAAKQPFHFGEYRGIFRWYSYALHGTQDPSRIGKCSTGGCINTGEKDLAILLEKARLGMPVSVRLMPR